MAPSLAPTGVLTLDELRSMPAGDVTDAVMGRAWAWRTPGWRGARPTVLAIDPGNRVGWAHITTSKTPYTGGSRDWSDAWCASVLAESKADLVVCEDAYLGRDPRAFARLAWMVGTVRAFGRVGGIHVVRVLPPTWQAAMLGGHHARAEGKARSIDVARRRVDPRIRDDHAADAALIALYALVGG